MKTHMVLLISQNILQVHFSLHGLLCSYWDGMAWGSFICDELALCKV